MDVRRPRPAVTAAVVAFLAAGIAAGCSGTDPESVGTGANEPPPPSSPPTAAPAAPPNASPAPTVAPGPVTLAFAGDIHFEGALRDRLADPATALTSATETLAAADLAIVNLETSVGAGGDPEAGKRFTFQAPPTAFTALAAAGIDIATMANNHALDYGREPLPGTFAAMDAAAAAEPPLAVIGLGRDAADAFTPARHDIDGTLVATLGATVADDDPTADPTGRWAATDASPGTADAIEPTRLLAAVGAADRSADVVVVYLHWGIQGERCPSPEQQDLAAELVAAGADVVVGSHTHRLQGDGRLGDGYVAYGLGNFAWYTQASEATTTTGVLTLTVDPASSRAGEHASVGDAVWSPARIGSDGLPVPLAGTDADRFESDLASLRACAGITP